MALKPALICLICGALLLDLSGLSGCYWNRLWIFNLNEEIGLATTRWIYRT